MEARTAFRRLTLLFCLSLVLAGGQAAFAATGPWTFLTPTPTGNTLYDAYSPDGGGVVYHVGDGGLILKQTGTTFTVMDTGTTAPLRGIHGSGPNDIWAVGGSSAAPTSSDPLRSVLLHFDGSVWTATTPPVWTYFTDLYPMEKVWVADDGQAFAVSNSSSLPAKWNAVSSKWEFEDVADPQGKLVNYETLYDIFGFSAQDVYAVGTYGTILHRDASGWSAMVQFENSSSSTSFNLLQSVWGPDADHVFTGGNFGQLYRLMPSQSPDWAQVNPMGGLFSSNSINAMAGSGPDDIWMVGLAGVIRRWTGAIDNLENHDDATGKGRLGILPVDAGAYQTDGLGGLMEHMDGATAARTNLNVPVQTANAWKAVGFGGKLWLAPAWSGAAIGVSSFSRGKLTSHPIEGIGASVTVTAFKVFSRSDFWYSGYDGDGGLVLLRGDGTNWSSWLPPGSFGSMAVSDVVKTPSGEYAIIQYAYSSTGMPCVVGSEALQCPSSQGADAYLYAALAAAENGDVYAVGKGGRLARWSGGQWNFSVIGENGDDLYAAAAGPDMLVAAGANGAAFYSTDGAAWSPVTGIERIEPIGGTPLYDFTSVVHAGGGVFWATLTRPTKWIDGGVSSLYRIQNGHAELVQGGFTNPINSLAAASGQDAVFAAGEGGVIMTTNASYKETGISPPFLLLLLN